MARTARIWSDIDVAMIDFFAEKKADEGNPSLRVLAARLGMKHTRVGDLFNKTNGTPTLQEFIDLCLGFNVKPSNVLDNEIARHQMELFNSHPTVRKLEAEEHHHIEKPEVNENDDLR